MTHTTLYFLIIASFVSCLFSIINQGIAKTHPIKNMINDSSQVNPEKIPKTPNNRQIRDMYLNKLFIQFIFLLIVKNNVSKCSTNVDTNLINICSFHNIFNSFKAFTDPSKLLNFIKL